MDFIELAKSRYSCKKFDSRQISKEQLDSILEAGRLAPTAKNLQEQHVYVVQSAEALAKVDALTPCRYGAPTMLIVAFDKNNVFTYPGQKYDSGIEDATIVTTHMMLCAKSVGVDSCWVNFFDPDKMAETFQLRCYLFRQQLAGVAFLPVFGGDGCLKLLQRYVRRRA